MQPFKCVSVSFYKIFYQVIYCSLYPRRFVPVTSSFTFTSKVSKKRVNIYLVVSEYTGCTDGTFLDDSAYIEKLKNDPEFFKEQREIWLKKVERNEKAETTGELFDTVIVAIPLGAVAVALGSSGELALGGGILILGGLIQLARMPFSSSRGIKKRRTSRIDYHRNQDKMV